MAGPSISSSRVTAIFLMVAALLLVAISRTSGITEERKAVWVAAQESTFGLNVVRDDGRVVSYEDVSFANGPRIIPGLKDIVATTARLALRRDGVVLTWQPKCTGGEREFCEFPAARQVSGLRGIVAIAQHQQCYLALDRDGTVWGWGDDSDGLISGRPAVPRSMGKAYKRRFVDMPTRIPLPVPMVSISAGVAQGGAVDREGRAWTWGGGRSAEFLQAPGEDVASPNGFVARRIAGLPPIRVIDVNSTAYAVTATGELWRWGVSRVNGVRGSTVPSRVSDLTNIVAVSHVGSFTAIMDGEGIVFFIGLAPDQRDGKFLDEPQASKLPARAKFISAGARIDAEGAVVWFNDIRRGGVRRLELGR